MFTPIPKSLARFPRIVSLAERFDFELKARFQNSSSNSKSDSTTNNNSAAADLQLLHPEDLQLLQELLKQDWQQQRHRSSSSSPSELLNDLLRPLVQEETSCCDNNNSSFVIAATAELFESIYESRSAWSNNMTAEIVNFLDSLVIRVECFELNKTLMDEEMNCLYDSEVSDDEDDDDDEQLSINFENIKDLFDPEASAYGERFINDSAAEIEEDYLIACKPLENCVDADSSCKLNRLGQTCSIYKNMAIVSSTEAINRVLREGTDIFDSDGHFIGRVVEIFGNVQCPMYAVQLKEEKLNDIDQSTMSLYYQSDSASAPFMHLQNEIDRSTATDA